jgi:peptidoglycan/LPS O-acetylase OafA/YrhL
MRRTHELDALRGIAAMTVVFSHLWLTLPQAWQPSHPSLHGLVSHPLLLWLKYSPGRLLVAGPAAVTLFFVLSGFVLSASLDRGPRLSFAAFAVKRLCRIALPFLAAVLLASILFEAVGAIPAEGVSDWFTSNMWSEPLTGRLIAGHALMFGTQRFQTLDPPMWSLIVELRVSLVFPLIFALVMLRPLVGSTLIMGMYAAASLYMTQRGQSLPQDAPGTLAFTVEFLPLFMLGVLLYRFRETASRGWCAMPWGARLSAVLGVACCFCLPNLGPETTISPAVKLGWMASLGFASSTLIVVSLNSAIFSRVLLTAPLQWIGRVSYSLYLTHMLVVLTLLRALGGVLPVAAIVAAVVPCSLALAYAMYRWVELPSMRLGQELARPAAREHPARQ